MKLKDLLDDRSKANLISYAGAGCIIVLFYLILNHLPIIGDGIKAVVNALMPFIFGCVIAFLLLPFRRLVENQLLGKTKLSFHTKRLIAVTASILLLFLVLVIFFALLMPQLVSSITTFVESFGDYAKNLEQLLNPEDQTGEVGMEIATFINGMISNASSSLQTWLTGASGGLQKIIFAGVNVVSNIFNFLIGIIVATYLLYDAERFKKTFKKALFAFLPKKNAEWIMYVLGLNRAAFNGFIFGKIIDSLIIGIICYICVSLLGIPYSILIAVIIGLTNVVPVFGPFIGAVPCLLILVMIDPWAALKFLIFIIILQQVDGNIIGPKILGGSLGLPTLWIMFAIIVGGALFGVVGMIVGVPIFSVLYRLLSDWMDARLNKKKIVIQ